MSVVRIGLAALVFFAVGCAHRGRGIANLARSSEIGDETEAYVRAEVALHLASDENEFEEALAQRTHVEERVRRKVPGGVRSGIASESSVDARLGLLVGLLSRGGVGETEVQRIGAAYSGSDAYFVRLFSVRVLAMGDDRVVAANSGAIASAILREANDSIRASSLPLVARLRDADRTLILVHFIRTGSPLLAKKAYSVAWSCGRSIACEVRTRVVNLGMGGGLESIEKVESSANQGAFDRNGNACAGETQRQ